ncbi:hypothetical protein EHS39_11600 [Ensifer sp. MPMI2T]|nr:hypothetical protein EHS39_11600 [Ensifer sp. MPMI2T]
MGRVMRLDHGALNVPLHKRGDIDKQIDAHKAEQAKEARTKRRSASEQTARDREEAKRLLDAATDEHIRRLAERCCKTVAAMRKHLLSEAHWQPKLIIGIFS